MEQMPVLGKYQPYPEYKDSGVEWLGAVPTHWNVHGGKRIFSQRREPAFQNDVQLAASQAYGVVPQSLLMEMTGNKVMLALKGTDSFKHVSAHDFVISLRSFEGGIEHSSYTGCVSPAYTVLNAVKIVAPWFYRYLLKSSPYISALQASTDSLRDGKSITYEQFGAILLPLPALEEQRTIAAFLDYETARIDKLIAQQQRLIELLKEKRQAVISHCVSIKAAEGHVKLSYAVNLITGFPFLSTGFRHEPGDNIPLLRGINVGVDQIKWDEVVYWASDDCEHLKEYFLKSGDIVFGMDRPWISSGARVAEITSNDTPCLLLQRVARIRTTDSFYQPFIRLCLSSNEFRAYVEADLTGVSVPHISPDQIKSFYIRNISLEEQRVITDRILAKIEKLNAIEKTAFYAIELMQERRTALISAAVTGKIDLRGWTAPTQGQ
ncbi:TPA: restriction endonuclease subunit S [Klebsiella pneumoniae]